MKVLVTGVAGFIGMFVAQRLLARGDRVVGIDNLNDYYDPALKADRLAHLNGSAEFAFHHSTLPIATAWPRCSPASVSMVWCTSARRPACAIR